MTTVFLLRHGLTKLTGPVLAGRTPGVKLDERGRRQSRAAAERLAVLPLATVVTSPLDRCAETARAVLAGQRAAGRTPARRTDRRLLECDYGDWTGRQIKSLVKDPLWPVVQSHPSGVTFPNGESMSAMADRGVRAIRDLSAKVAAEHGEHAVWLACSHGDLIKAILADALGMHLDLFQRIVVDPGSISAVRYAAGRPFVLFSNSVSGDLSPYVPVPPKPGRRRRTAADATVGGGAGAGTV
ncbi:MAG TPA: MSMEG_4193 family putative phosphomutase [Jatrophihabitans sp.]|nr:MSMEG_4193 family putative phosphomutase [Jatrophihabitans sp.]